MIFGPDKRLAAFAVGTRIETLDAVNQFDTLSDAVAWAENETGFSMTETQIQEVLSDLPEADRPQAVTQLRGIA